MTRSSKDAESSENRRIRSGFESAGHTRSSTTSTEESRDKPVSSYALRFDPSRFDRIEINDHVVHASGYVKEFSLDDIGKKQTKNKNVHAHNQNQ